MAIYDLYGCASHEIHHVKEHLEAVLQIRFDTRESDYQGGEYFHWGSTSDEHFVLKRNIDPIDGAPAELRFPAHKILLYLNDTRRSEELKQKIREGVKDLVILRHEDLD